MTECGAAADIYEGVAWLSRVRYTCRKRSWRDGPGSTTTGYFRSSTLLEMSTSRSVDCILRSWIAGGGVFSIEYSEIWGIELEGIWVSRYKDGRWTRTKGDLCSRSIGLAPSVLLCLVYSQSWWVVMFTIGYYNNWNERWTSLSSG